MVKKVSENSGTAIFQIAPQSNTRVKCRLLGYCDGVDKLNDDVLGDMAPVHSVNGYSVTSRFCACNLPGNYLVSNKKVPVFYMPILYTKKNIVSGCLFNITFFFTIGDETKQKLDTEKKYMGAFVDGTYSFEMVVPGEDKFLDKIMPMVKGDDMEMETKMNEYRKFMVPTVFGEDMYPSKKLVHKRLGEFCDNVLFRELLELGLQLREKERRDERCPDISLEPPKNVISLREISENPGKLDEIFEQRRVARLGRAPI